MSRPADRDQVVAQMRGIENTRRQNARARAARLGMPIRSVLANGRVQEIADFDGDRPIYLTTNNADAAISSGADLLRASPYSLTGSGVTIGLWDGGSARSTHQEFNGRVTVMDGSFAITHATHVGGTLIASGIVASARGMATGAMVNSYDWTNDTSEMTSRGATFAGEPGKIQISNHSYNYISGWNYVDGGTPYRLWEWYGFGTSSGSIETDFGRYNSYARDIDSLAFSAPYYLIFRSAGNDNTDSPAPGSAVALSPGSSSVVSYNSTTHPAGDGASRGGFETIAFNAIAKNVITVGSTLDAVTNGTRDPAKATLNDFSACGPTDDGRIKPDVVANGDSVYSTFGTSNNAYGTYSGTSMATPCATGSAALLIEQFNSLFPGQAMRASTLKGLLIHTADDRGNAGPDYKYGWGLLNVQAAADLIRDQYETPAKQRITENQISTTVTTRTVSFEWDGISPISATLVWTDPAGATISFSDSRSANLVNNLDLKIIAPNGSEYFPFVMPFVGTWTEASMNTPAVTGINNTDNVEQVRIDAPPIAGLYQTVVSYSGSLTNGSQKYSLLLNGSFVGPPTPPANPVATPGNNTITLTWDAPGTASTYQVKRSLTSGGPYTALGSTANTSYADTSVTNGTAYFYVVSASNGSGVSADSAESSAIPAALASSTSLASLPVTEGDYLSPVTFTATVDDDTATGTVTFFDGATELGTGTLDATGHASLTTSTLALGGHPITASYAGDPVFGPSTSAPLDFTINPKAVSITGVSAADKVYDGTTTATLSGGAVSGIASGETVTVTTGTGTFADPNAGTHTVSATEFALGGSDAGNYRLSGQPLVPSASITPRPVELTGTHVYDGSSVASDILTVSNNLDGADLSATGTVILTDRNVGSQALAIHSPAARVQFATGDTGSNMMTSFGVNLNSPPVSGNTLVAVISTRGTSANRISGLTQTGASWSRACQSTNIYGSTTEIWYASNVSNAGTAITIHQAGLRSAAVVTEYSGVLTASPLDQISEATGNNSSPTTGTTATTGQNHELWIGGIGLSNSNRYLGTPGNGFTTITSAESTRFRSSSNAKVYALERMATQADTASSSGSIYFSTQWSGAIATFKTHTPTSLTLTGPAAGNYTLTNAVGLVTITPRPITLSAVTATKTYDGTKSAPGIPVLSEPLVPGDTTMDLSQSYLSSDASDGDKVIIPSITINDGNGGANYSITTVNDITGTITPAPAQISLDDLPPVVYDGTPKSATATTTPPGLDFSITYDDTTTPPTLAGAHAVTAFITDTNYQATPATASLVIDKAQATIDLSGLTPPFDGTPKPVTAATTPADLAVSITYDASPVAPALFGTYEIAATIADPNYQGSASAQLVIEPGNDLISWKYLHFSESERLAGLADENANPDADDWPNLAEYAMGTNPHSFTPPLPATLDPDGFSITFTCPADLPDVSYGAESSEDFATWMPIPLELLDTGDTETLRALDALDTGDPSRRFLRLRFTRP